MDADQAITRAKTLLGDPSSLTAEDWSDAVALAVTIDDQGRMPSNPDWTPSYEPYWTAAMAAETMAVREALTGSRLAEFTSEGTTIKTDAGKDWFPGMNWSAAAQRLRRLSPLTALADSLRAGSGFGTIDVGGGLDYDTRSEGWRP